MSGSLISARLRTLAFALLLGTLAAGCSPESGNAPAADAPAPEAPAAAPPVEAVTPAPPAAPPAAAPVSQPASCCSCDFAATAPHADPRLPCRVDFPASWEVIAGGGAMVSALGGPPRTACTQPCAGASPAMSVSFAMVADPNAEAMQAIWPDSMPVVGEASCGDGTVRFFGPPGADESGLVGGVRFYVQVGGSSYRGGAQFTCPEPGGWQRLRALFVDSFDDNPDSTFPGG